MVPIKYLLIELQPEADSLNSLNLGHTVGSRFSKQDLGVWILFKIAIILVLCNLEARWKWVGSYFLFSQHAVETYRYSLKGVKVYPTARGYIPFLKPMSRFLQRWVFKLKSRANLELFSNFQNLVFKSKLEISESLVGEWLRVWRKIVLLNIPLAVSYTHLTLPTIYSV